MERKTIPDREFFEKVAEQIAKVAKQVLAKKERMSMALSGGTTPRALYETFTSERWKDKIEWDRIDFFFGDERDVSPMSERSNFRMANEFFFKPLEIQPSQIFRWQTEIIEVNEVASSYERTIRRYFDLAANEVPVFDLFLLGMGDDGHTASLFPFTRALDVTDRLAVANRVEKFDSNRLTMTYPVINNAFRIFFIVPGFDKAKALRDVLEGEQNFAKFPAQRIKPVKRGKLLWFISSSAGSELGGKSAASKS
jgi:6-phosphogluconolactonase